MMCFARSAGSCVMTKFHPPLCKRFRSADGLSKARGTRPGSSSLNDNWFLLRRICRGGARVRGVDAADRFAGEHQLHAAVLLPSFRRVVGGHRFRLSETAGNDRALGNALLDQVVAHSLRAIAGKLHVVVVTA